VNSIITPPHRATDRESDSEVGRNITIMSQIRSTFVLGAFPHSTGLGASTAAAASSFIPSAPIPSTTAQASHASTDPIELHSHWRVRSLLSFTVDALARELTGVPMIQLETLPPELSELVCEAASNARNWNADKLIHATQLIAQTEQLSIAQCDALKSDELITICSKLQRPLLRVDLSRSYYLADLKGLLAAPQGLASLRVLDLDRCRRISSVELLPILALTPSLEELRLSGTRVNDDLIRALGDTTDDGMRGRRLCPLLKKLDVSACMLADGLAALCKSVPPLPLHTLYLTQTNFTNEQLNELKYLAPTLNHLYMQFMPKLRDSCLSSIGACTNLITLDLARNANVSDAGFSALRPLINLTALHVSHIDLTPDSREILGEFRRLEILDLSYNAEITDVMLVYLCQRLRRLRVLILTFCTSITDRSIVEGIIPYLRRVQVLKINGCKQIGDISLAAIAEKGEGGPIPISNNVQDFDVQLESDTNDATNDAAAATAAGSAAAPDQTVSDSTTVGASAGNNVRAHSLTISSTLPTGSSISSSDTSMTPLTSTPISGSPGAGSYESEAADAAALDAIPLVAFPHSLLSFECGSTKTTDACIISLASLLPKIKLLQRVAIWNSNISAPGIKNSIAGWRDGSTSVGMDGPGCNQVHPPSSAWLLDESMKTAPGTFILVRRGIIPLSLMNSFQCASAVPSATVPLHLYGMEDTASRLRRNRSKTVSWREEQLAEFIAPKPEWIRPVGEIESEEESDEEDTGSVIRNDDDDDDDEEDEDVSRESSVQRISDGDEGSAQSSVVRNEDEEEGSAQSSVVRADSGDDATAAASAAKPKEKPLYLQFRANAL
jgi:hypothetical protein